jgi:hypothetical protein
MAVETASDALQLKNKRKSTKSWLIEMLDFWKHERLLKMVTTLAVKPCILFRC